MDRISWLKSIFPDFVEHEWMKTNVIKPSDINLFEFYEPCGDYESIINPQNIIGIEYGFNYNDSRTINWKELLHSLKRFDWIMGNFHNLEDLQNHIQTNNDQKIVKRFGDDFITISGQHRLCLAKFLNIKEVKVQVRGYKLNEKWMSQFCILKKYKTEFFH